MRDYSSYKRDFVNLTAFRAKNKQKKCKTSRTKRTAVILDIEDKYLFLYLENKGCKYMELKLSLRETWISALIIILLFPIDSPAASRKMSELTTRSAQELFQLASESLEHKNAPDSALYYLAGITFMADNDSSSNIPFEIYANAFNATGAIYASVYGNYSTAALNLLKGLDIARRNGCSELENQILYNLTALEYEQGRLTSQPEIRQRTFNKFIKILDSLSFEDDKDLAYSLAISSVGLNMRSNPQEIGKLIKRVRKVKRLSPELKEIYNACLMLEARDFSGLAEATESLASKFRNSKSVHSRNCLSEILLIRADALLLSGNEKTAMDAYQELVSRCNESGDLFRVFEIYSFLREYFEKKNNLARASEFEIKELRSKDNLINRSRSLSLEGSRALYNEDKLKHEIASEIARTKILKTVLTISAIFLSILLFLLWLLFRKLKQIKRSRNIIVRNDMEHFGLVSMHHDSNKESVTTRCESKEKRVFDKVMAAVRDSAEIFEEDFNTGRLAVLVKEKPSVISAAIAETTGETTSQFLARIRIREACRRINDTATYGDYTIEAIGQSVGYRSRSHFGTVFKKIVGMTPSEYSAKIRDTKRE